MRMVTGANMAAAVDAPMTPLFAFGCQWRRATDAQRWTKEYGR